MRHFCYSRSLRFLSVAQARELISPAPWAYVHPISSLGPPL